MKLTTKTRRVLMGLAMGTLVSFAQAADVPVINYSFEDNVAPGSGGVVSTDPTGWISFGKTGSTDIGSQWANSAQYTINTPLASPAQGNQFVYINIFPENPNGSGGIYQDVGALQPFTLYTLTVAIGSRADRVNSPGVISLVNGTNNTGTLLATGGGFPSLQNTWQDFSINFTTGAIVSGNLTIVLSTAAAGTIQADFDNVRLTAVSAVPEPGTYGMAFALMLLGVVYLRRRRLAAQ